MQPNGNNTVRVRGPYILAPVALGAELVNGQLQQVDSRVPEVSVDYSFDKIENIVFEGNECECDIVGADEAAILLDTKYTVIS